MAPSMVRGEHVDFAVDIASMLAGSAFLLSIRWAMHKVWTRDLAKRMMGLDKVEKLSKVDSNGVEKWCKYMWHLIVYVALFAWGVKIILTEEWSPLKTGTMDSCWEGYPQPAAEKPAVKHFHMAQVAWYMHGFVESLLVDNMRADFALMLVHHLLAACLLTGAFWGNAHRVAVVVCVEQDLSDILMYLSKMIQKASAVPWTQNKTLHAYLLYQLTIAWWCTRCVTLGTIVYRCFTIIGPTGLITPWGNNVDPLSTYLSAQLFLLFVMQVFWGMGLLKMCFDLTFKESWHDIFHDSKQKEGKKA